MRASQHVVERSSSEAVHCTGQWGRNMNYCVTGNGEPM